MAEIRWATDADIPQLVALGAVMHAESPRFSPCVYDPVKVAGTAQQLIRSPERGCVLVAEKGGRIVGTIAGFLNEHWFGPSKYAADLAIFVYPEWRGGSFFVKLVLRFEDWARGAGAEEVILGANTGVAPEVVRSLYARLGYVNHGTCYVKRL